MGNEGRQRFPDRKPGSPDVSRGSNRKPDSGKVTAVVSPQGPKSKVTKKHPKTDGAK